MRISGANSALSSSSPETKAVPSVQPVKWQSRLEEVKPTVEEEGQAEVGEQREQVADQEQVSQALEKVNESLNLLNRRMEFRVHESTNRIMVRVIDKETNKVVKEIPPEKFLDMAAKLQDLVGLLVDQKA